VGHREYYRLGRMWNGAVGDFDMVALLESRKRGSERVSKEDRKAAMKVWQAEDRKLKCRIMRDPTFELQIKSVAKWLSLRGKLDGDEVRRAMDEVSRCTKIADFFENGDFRHVNRGRRLTDCTQTADRNRSV
jgi:hypothetical protein